MRERKPKGAGCVIVRKRRDGSVGYKLKVTREGQNYYRTVDAPSRKAAEDLLHPFIAEIQSGAVATKRAEAKQYGEQPTLAEWSETFLSQHVSGQTEDRSATIAAYRNVLRLYVLPTLGRHKLADISGPMVRKCFQDVRRTGKSVSTIQLAHAALRKALEQAKDDGHLKDNPTPRFSKILGRGDSSTENAKRSALKAPQVAALLEACGDDPSLHLFVSIMACCGLRPGEALGLQWRNVDLKKGNLHVRNAAKLVYRAKGEAPKLWLGSPKTKSGKRDLAIGPALANLFTAERERQEGIQRELLGRDPNVRDMSPLLPPDACVFCADPATAEGLRLPQKPHAVGRQFKRAAKRAGLPEKVSPHWMRHTAISHWLSPENPDNRLSLADAAKLAGHANPAITAAIYTHAVAEGAGRAAAIGDSLLSPAKGATVEPLPAVKGQREEGQ